MISLQIPATAESVSLYKLLAGLRGAIAADTPLQLRLTIAAGQRCEIIDDLAAHGIEHSTIELVLATDAAVSYRCEIIDRAVLSQVAAQTVTASTASGEIVKKLTCIFEGQGAEAKLLCVCLGSGTQKFSFDTLQHHKAPDTKSNLLIKGVLADEAHLRCDNLIRIEKEAQRTDAQETNKNLLLGKKSRVVTVPKLEVEADDVGARHGAAVSRISDEDRFYLESRGIEPGLAHQMLIEAFLS